MAIFRRIKRDSPVKPWLAQDARDWKRVFLFVGIATIILGPVLTLVVDRWSVRYSGATALTSDCVVKMPDGSLFIPGEGEHYPNDGEHFANFEWRVPYEERGFYSLMTSRTLLDPEFVIHRHIQTPHGLAVFDETELPAPDTELYAVLDEYFTHHSDQDVVDSWRGVPPRKTYNWAMIATSPFTIFIHLMLPFALYGLSRSTIRSLRDSMGFCWNCNSDLRALDNPKHCPLCGRACIEAEHEDESMVKAAPHTKPAITPWRRYERTSYVRNVLIVLALTCVLAPGLFAVLAQGYKGDIGHNHYLEGTVWMREDGSLFADEQTALHATPVVQLADFSYAVPGRECGPGMYRTSERFKAPKFYLQDYRPQRNDAPILRTNDIPAEGTDFRNALNGYFTQQDDEVLKAAWAGDPPERGYEWGTLLKLAVHILIALTIAYLAIDCVFKIRRRLRIARGRCWACGYDLRGLDAPQRCPECGEMVEYL